MSSTLSERLTLICLTAALAGVGMWSLTVGASLLSYGDIVHALSNLDEDSREAAIVWSVRLPRLLAAIAVGSALAIAGAIMQAATGNPLADPGLLGVNAGAAFGVVILTVVLGPAIPVGVAVWVAFAGAALAAIAVYGLGMQGRSGATPIKLILAGVVVGTFLGTISMSLLILDTQAIDAVRLWTAGSLKGRNLDEVLIVAPYIAFAAAASLVLRDQFTSLSLGPEAARSLGQNPGLWRGISALLVVLLAGSSVAIAGPLGFVGLVVPHIARMIVGADYRRIIPFALLGGAILTVLADTLPRAVWRNDVPVGISLAVIGAPFFIWLARNRLGSTL